MSPLAENFEIKHRVVLVEILPLVQKAEAHVVARKVEILFAVPEFEIWLPVVQNFDMLHEEKNNS